MSRLLPPIDLMIVGGGGSYNKSLMKLIKEYAPFEVITQDYGYRSDAKEAIGFVVLGDMTLKQLQVMSLQQPERRNQ